MKLLTVFTVLVLSIVPISAIAARPAISEGEYVFAGFSDVTMQGYGPGALQEYQNACTAKFGSGARWASSKEMMEATAIPIEPESEYIAAWVRPIIIDTTWNEGEIYFTEYSGLVAHDLSCLTPAAFSYGDGLAYFIAEGWFSALSCIEELHVACSNQP